MEIKNNHRIIIVTNNLNRYSANTQMQDVINWILSQPETIEINIRSIFLSGGSVVEYLTNFIDASKAELLIFIDGPPLLELSIFDMKLLSSKIYVAMFFGDIFAHFQSCYKYYTQVIDCALVDESVETGRFKLYGVDSIFVPYTYDVNDSIGDNFAKELPLSFIGRMDRVGRREYLDLAAKHFPISIYGVGTPKGPVTNMEMDKIFRTSIINLNFTGVQFYQPYRYANTIDLRVRSAKGRCQEIALRGGFVLSENAPEIEKLFIPGKEIDVFDNNEEFLEKINFYLKNPDIANKIAEKGKKRANLNYRIEIVWTKTISDLTQKARIRNLKPHIVTGLERVTFDQELELSIAREFILVLKGYLKPVDVYKVQFFLKIIGIKKAFKHLLNYLLGRF